MVNIARTALPVNKTFYIALQRIFGVGRTTGLEIAEACGISKELKVRPHGKPLPPGLACPCSAMHACCQSTPMVWSIWLKVKDVKEPYIKKVAQYIQENMVVGDPLKRQIRENILQLIEMKSYRGSRWERLRGGMQACSAPHGIAVQGGERPAARSMQRLEVQGEGGGSGHSTKGKVGAAHTALQQ